MFSRAKDEKTKRRTAAKPQLGIFDIPDISGEFDPDDNDDGTDDEDLEAELFALTSGGAPKVRKKAPPKATPHNLDAMVAESLKDSPSDDEESVNENDPELLAELGGIVEVSDESPEKETAPEKEPATTGKSHSNLESLLKERLQMYEKAEQNAKASNESSRARRLARGIKTLKDQLKQVSAGRVINEEEIPPPVAVTVRNKEEDASSNVPSGGNSRIGLGPPTPTAPPAEKPQLPVNQKESGPEDEILKTLNERRNAYRHEALRCKKDGENEQAIKYVRIVKQFDCVIAAVKGGNPVDLSEMPPMPGGEKIVSGMIPNRPAPPVPPPRSKQQSILVKSTEDTKEAEVEEKGGEAIPEQPAAPAVPKAVPPPPPAPTTVMEALEQRLQRYKEAEQSAKDEGNSSKARRLGRIVKQYQSALAAHSKGKPVAFDELPTPPGFAPIPGQPVAAPLELPNVNITEKEEAPEVPDDDANTKNVTPTQPPIKPRTPPKEGQPSNTDIVRPPGEQMLARHEQQLELLLKRQAVFKKAALEAKKNGDLAQAREYLRAAKGFDPLIEASHSGLPVDMSTLPVPPQEKATLQETDFDIVTTEDCIPGSVTEVYEKLEENLVKQVTMCMTTRDHFRAVGDVGSANRFEQLALDSKKDLDAVRAALKAHKIEVAKMEESGFGQETPPPRFHYETRTFSIVKCNTDLSDNDFELSVVKGINYNVPNNAETYVRFEFPFPTESPQRDKTHTAKDNNPDYEHMFLLSINRSSRACQRIFKRQVLKLEVWSRGSWLGYLCCYCCGKSACHDSFRGFFRGDSLIGTANVKLQPMETNCTVHDSFPLMEGRKAVGGKIEVKIRIRNPILGRQVEKVTEKWLIIDKL